METTTQNGKQKGQEKMPEAEKIDGKIGKKKKAQGNVIDGVWIELFTYTAAI